MFLHEHIKLDYVDLPSETLSSGRTYTTPAGTKYPSITTVLGADPAKQEGLQKWRERVGAEEADKIGRAAAYRGTKVHEAMENYVDNIKPKIMNPIIRDGFNKIKKVVDADLSKVYAQEKALYSDYLGVAGRVDLVGRFRRKNSIIDFKTSASHKPHEWIHGYFVQETFYAIAWEERTGMPIEQLVTIIANDEDREAQVFIEHRDNWAPELLKAIAYYKENCQ